MISFVGFQGTEYGERKDGSKPYYDESLNVVIQSKKHKEEELAKRNLCQMDSGARKNKKGNTSYFEAPNKDLPTQGRSNPVWVDTTN